LGQIPHSTERISSFFNFPFYKKQDNNRTQTKRNASAVKAPGHFEVSSEILKPGHRMHFFSSKSALKTQAANAANFVKIKQIKRSNMVTYLQYYRSKAIGRSKEPGLFQTGHLT